MRIRLTLVHQESPDSPTTYVFEQDQVLIGRAAQNDLTLEDPTSVVSKRHAQLRAGPAGLTVEDLGSKNFTFVNGQRLVANQAHTLRPGDRLEIGPYAISVDVEEEAARDLEQTVFAAGFTNPFEEGAQELAEVLGQLRRAVMTSSYQRRDEALLDALRQAMGPGEEVEILHAVLRGEDPPARSAGGSPAADQPPWKGTSDLEHPASWQTPAERTTPDWRPPGAQDEPPAADRLPERPGHAAQPPLEPLPDDLTQRLLGLVTRLVGVPFQFRHEFIGHTILHAPETAFLYDGDPAALHAYLTQGPDRDERLRLVEDAVEQVLLHQVAMLDGYRAAAEAGAGTLLDAVDPDSEDESPPENAMGKLLSAVKGGGGLERVRERVRELRSESVSVLERRFFRPAFIDAYLARLADHRPPSNNRS